MRNAWLEEAQIIALTRGNYIYIYKHICTHTYVRKSFEKEYNSNLDEENKSTIFFNVHVSSHVGSKTLPSNVVYVYADKRNNSLNLVTSTAEELIYNS